uniref:Reverse transcriptase domain-containing protein n=1 Tax=Tanacetum cinerariifolium TaxID=118510 RepID=A0A6L2K6G2_TANCI|nr:reverse transcriptase domain-containing protein [Tanacetum cinerariifolium]
MIPTTSSPLKVVEHETKMTKDTVPPTNNGSTKDAQPPVIQVETQIPNSEPVIAPVDEPVEAPVSAPKPNPKPSIPYPSRFHDQKLREKTNDQKEKFLQIFQDLNFNISFADALILMPKFGPTIKSLLTNKEKLFDLARTPLNEHCLTVLLKKLPEKLGDPDKFLIPCDFLGMDECLALADLGASINLMPLSVWNKLSLPRLSPTCMTLELTDSLISRPVGVAKDVFVKVGTFHLLADFVVVDFDADPRVPLILERSFLKTGRALIDVYKGELTLCVGNKSITFNLDQTLRYSANYDAMSVNRIDLIDVACEEYSQEVLRFSVSGNPTPSTKPIVSISSPTLTPFGDSDFLLEETDAFLAIDDEPILPEIDDSFYDSKGDILLLEEFLNDDPSSPPLPPQDQKVVEPKNEKSSIDELVKSTLRKFLEIDDSFYDSKGDILLLEEFLNDDPSSPPLPPQDQKVVEPKNEKSSIDELPMVKLKDLPPHLEYEFLECDDKLPIIIAEDLKDVEKTALIKVLKSHKQALAWKLFDIKGGFTVVKNEENELILTQLVTGWRVCIDYRKLNDATHKVHFPLPFMDQMLKRLAGNKYYCFLDGFSGYFQIPIDPQEQEKTIFTCPYKTFAFCRMPFGLCNAPGTFQRCMMAIFHGMIEKRWKSLWTTSRSLGILSELASPIWTRCLSGVKTPIFV